MSDNNRDFENELNRVRHLATDIVELKDEIYYLDEDGSRIMLISHDDNGNIIFNFMLSDKRFSVKEGIVNAL